MCELWYAPQYVHRRTSAWKGPSSLTTNVVPDFFQKMGYEGAQSGALGVSGSFAFSQRFARIAAVFIIVDGPMDAVDTLSERSGSEKLSDNIVLHNEQP